MQSQYWSIDRLPGLMLPEQKLLQSEGIANTADLSKRTRSPQSKQDLASKLKLNQKHVNKWVALADLARLPSVGDRYCGLLLHLGLLLYLSYPKHPAIACIARLFDFRLQPYIAKTCRPPSS